MCLHHAVERGFFGTVALVARRVCGCGRRRRWARGSGWRRLHTVYLYSILTFRESDSTRAYLVTWSVTLQVLTE